MIKYKKVSWKFLKKNYKWTMLWVVNVIIQSLIYPIPVSDKMYLYHIQSGMFFMGLSLGMMLTNYMCERIHSPVWIKEMIGKEIDKAFLLVEADIVKDKEF